MDIDAYLVTEALSLSYSDIVQEPGEGVLRQVGLKEIFQHELSVTIVKRAPLRVKMAPLRRVANRQPAEGLTELIYRLAFDKQQNGVLGHVGLSHLFVGSVNRLCISYTGNDWSE
jgi:hypothetical protein